MISISTKGVKTNGTLGKIGQAISSPEGRAAIGMATGGPVNAAIGYTSTKEGRDKLKSAFGKLKLGPKSIDTNAPESLQEAQGGVQGAATTAQSEADRIKANPTQFQTATPASMQAATMDRTNLGPASLAQSANIAPVAQVQRTQLSPAALAQASEVQSADQQAVRQQQLAFVNALQQQAAGTAPSASMIQMQQNQDRALQQQAALAASARGGNLGIAQRAAQENMAMMSQQNIAEAQKAKLAEMQSAQGLLGQSLQGVRGADIGLAETQANLQQQAALANQGALNQANLAQGQLSQTADLSNQSALNQAIMRQAELQQQTALANQGALNQQMLAQGQLTSQESQALMQNQQQAAQLNAQMQQQAAIANQAADLQAKGMDQAQIAKMMGLSQEALQAILNSQTSQYGTALGARAANVASSNQFTGGIVGALGGLGAAAIAASDIRGKENIKKADSKGFLDALSSYEYNYKNPKAPGAAEGKRFGIMVQDLEKSEMGKSLIRELPDGLKGVDTVQGFGVALSAMSDLHKRLKQLERKGK